MKNAFKKYYDLKDNIGNPKDFSIGFMQGEVAIRNKEYFQSLVKRHAEKIMSRTIACGFVILLLVDSLYATTYWYKEIILLQAILAFFATSGMIDWYVSHQYWCREIASAWLRLVFVKEQEKCADT